MVDEISQCFRAEALLYGLESGKAPLAYLENGISNLSRSLAPEVNRARAFRGQLLPKLPLDSSYEHTAQSVIKRSLLLRAVLSLNQIQTTLKDIQRTNI